MSDETKTKAALATALVEELNEVVLAEPSEAPVPLREASPDLAEEIRTKMAEINLSDTGSIVGFGAGAQTGLQKISQSMLADVKNKDAGPAGAALREMVTTIRGFNVAEMDLRREKSWFEKLTGRAAPIARFRARFEDVQTQIDKITGELEAHEMKLLTDIKSLDQLYAKTLEFYDALAIYISAGEAKLSEIDETVIPSVEADLDQLEGERQTVAAQDLRDMRAARDDLERRVHDLKLTRQVTMQSLPSIRLVQENDKALVTKINSALVNTVPLWETQLAQGLTIQRSAEAAEAIAQANDLTNELLRSNAENLRAANEGVRTQMERGVFDIEAIAQANQTLIGTIEDSLRIADEGRAKRASAEAELQGLEAALRDTLAAASAPARKG